MPRVTPEVRNNVHVTGTPAGRPIMFAHSFGGSQQSWRFVAPAFEPEFRVVLFDHVGAGASDPASYDRAKYDSLHGYADDVIEIIDSLGMRDVTFVGHSVSAMIGVLASIRRPELFAHLVLVGPSPRYIDTDGYRGGFSRQAIEELLDSLDTNYVSFSSALAPVLVGDAGAELTADMAASIRTVDPEVASQFARATFLADNRRDLADVTVPTLILQSAEDNIAGRAVGQYVHEHIPGSQLRVIPARGHIPNLTDPEVLIRHIRDYLA